MENINSLMEWQPYQLIGAGLLVIVVNFSLGFSLWNSLSESQWTPFWHVASLLTGVGAFALAFTLSRLVVVEFLINLSLTLLILGVAMTVFGAISDVVHRLSLYRDTQNFK